MNLSRSAVPFRRTTTAALLITTLLLATSAQADPKTCITAHATGQREAKAGHLRLATQLFTSCGSDETCPSQLRQECAEFLKTVQQTIPTVIFTVIGDKNEDITAAKVFSTDELLVDGLDGRAIQVDPGKHHLRFLLPTGEILNSDVLIREGEKNRQVEVKVKGDVETEAATSEKPAPPASTPVVPPPVPQPVSVPSAHNEAHPVPLGFWIASGTALAGIGVGVTYAVFGKSEKNDLSDCAPYCGENMRGTYNNLKRDYLVADIGFGVGLVSAGVATYLYVSSVSRSRDTSPHTAAATPTLSRMVPAITFGSNGGYLSWSSGF